MIEVTTAAIKYLVEMYEKAEDNSAIRLAVMGSASTSSGLGLMLDAIVDSDVIFDRGEYVIVVDKSLLDFCKNVTIDFTVGQPDKCDAHSKRGFLLTAENPVNF